MVSQDLPTGGLSGDGVAPKNQGTVITGTWGGLPPRLWSMTRGPIAGGILLLWDMERDFSDHFLGRRC